MARKEQEKHSEVVSATVRTEMSRPFRAGLYARISMKQKETLERGTIETQGGIDEKLYQQIRKIFRLRKFLHRTQTIQVQILTGSLDSLQMMKISSAEVNCVIVKICPDLEEIMPKPVIILKYSRFSAIRFLAVTDDFRFLQRGVDLTVPLKNIINEFYSDLAKKNVAQSLEEENLQCLGIVWCRKSKTIIR